MFLSDGKVLVLWVVELWVVEYRAAALILEGAAS
jgi:hypothetical protein